MEATKALARLELESVDVPVVGRRSFANRMGESRWA
jgi:hypothetical protein